MADHLTIQLGEHMWQSPPIPKDSDILYHELPKAKQYWRRQTDIPDIFTGYGPITKVNADVTEWTERDGHRMLASLSKEDTKLLWYYLDREMRRRRDGLWFYNNGEPTYLTGDHYFILQWCKMYQNLDGGEYGSYREFQANFLYFVDLVEKDSNCIGGYIIKPKKTGITLLVAYMFLNRATLYDNKNYGMMSNSHDVCKATSMTYFKHALEGLPYVMLPAVNTDNKEEIVFDNPSRKNTGTVASQMKVLGNGKGLKNKLKIRPTREDAFDSVIYNLINLDEFPKCRDPYPAVIFEKTSQAVKIGGIVNGKILITTYTPETDDKSFKEGRVVYFDSKLSTRDAISLKTKSELYAYCISALDSYQTEQNRFDIYGKLDKDRVMQVISSRRDQLKNDRQKLQSFIRQFPLNEEEAWRYGGGQGSVFDNGALAIREQEITDSLLHGNIPYIEGRLEWTGPRKESEVRFVPLTEAERMEGKEAPFRIYGQKYLRHHLMQHTFNRPVLENLKDYKGRYRPPEDGIFCGATDPTDYALKSDVAVGSKNAITVMNFPDKAMDAYYGKRVTNRPVCVYKHRYESPREYYEDLVKAIFFFGMRVLPENNKPWVITMLKDDDLHNFILVMDAEGKAVPYKESEHQRLPSTQKDSVQHLCTAFSGYISRDMETGDSYLNMIEDERIIQDAMQFDATATKKFDVLMCFMWNLVGLNGMIAYRMRKAQRENGSGKEAMGELAKSLLGFSLK